MLHTRIWQCLFGLLSAVAIGSGHASPITIKKEVPMNFSMSGGEPIQNINDYVVAALPAIPDPAAATFGTVDLYLTGTVQETLRTGVTEIPNPIGGGGWTVSNDKYFSLNQSDGVGGAIPVSSGQVLQNSYNINKQQLNLQLIPWGFSGDGWNIVEFTGTSWWGTSADGDSHDTTINATLLAEYNLDTSQNQDLTQQAIDDIQSRDAVAENFVDPEPGGAFSWLRGVFLFVSDLIPRDDPEDIEFLEQLPGYDCGSGGRPKPCIGSIGFRGDAEEAVRQDLLNNPTPLYGDAGIWLETASPMSASTVIDVVDGEFVMSFDYTFLDAGSSLTVTLGGTEILSLLADEHTVGALETIELTLDWETITSELVFTLDGPSAGLGALIYNLAFPGRDILDTDDWFVDGNGTAEFVYVTSDVQMAALASSVVPVPAAAWLFGSALGLLGWMKRRAA